MKSVLSTNCCEKKEKPFPKLMKGKQTGIIYLFRSKRKATVVFSPAGRSNVIGEMYTELNSADGMYGDYEGDVCLTND